PYPHQYGHGELLHVRSKLAIRSLIASSGQSARNYLSLDLGCAFEDVKDARVAEDAADLRLERVTVAAVDLERRVSVRPGGACAKQLRHAGFDIASLTGILCASSSIAQLTRHDEIDQTHSDLVRDTREMDDLLAELLARNGIVES